MLKRLSGVIGSSILVNSNSAETHLGESCLRNSHGRAKIITASREACHEFCSKHARAVSTLARRFAIAAANGFFLENLFQLVNLV